MMASGGAPAATVAVSLVMPASPLTAGTTGSILRVGYCWVSLAKICSTRGWRAPVQPCQTSTRVDWAGAWTGPAGWGRSAAAPQAARAGVRERAERPARTVRRVGMGGVCSLLGEKTSEVGEEVVGEGGSGQGGVGAIGLDGCTEPAGGVQIG